MTFSLAPPSRNPTIDKKLRTVLRFVFSKLVQGSLDDMLPAQIVSYNRTSNMATVQPLIQIVTTLNQVQTRPQVASVPVVQLGGGGYTLNFNLKPGDLGFIKANDRDISLFVQFWRLVTPNTGRMHNFADGVFIPAALTGVTIAGSDTNNVVLQKTDGSCRLSIGDGNVCIADTVGYAQNIHSILDLGSTTRAFLPPRMTTTEKNAIASPVEGMVVYDLTEHGLSVYNGTMWS